MKMFNYEYDKVTGIHHPALYPGESSEKWVLPDDIRTDYGKLNTIIETKYTREFLKICAFYNKMFPSLKSSNWTRSFYNVPPFTSLDQERSDTGTGISSNYLKQIIDQVTSRLGTVTYDASLLSDMPTLEYIMYKDEVERLLRKYIRNEDLNQMSLEMFHDAAILGYSHALIDPYTHKYVKVNDYEAGFYEAQFNRGAIRQLLYRDYAFPVTELPIYLSDCDDETKEKIIEEHGNKATVDFKMYFDCPAQKVHVTIGGTTLVARHYPFDKVQMVTFSWDIGFSKVASTSLFDLLYPVQRELNKVNAKIQQLIRMYKGPVPVFNTDADIAMKTITNGSGEALYIDSARSATEMMTVINPTPLDPALAAEKQSCKTEMYELSGIQQVSFDMENMRSAAAVIALDQTRDTTFQSQMMGHADKIKKMFSTRVHYDAVIGQEESVTVDWKDIDKLITDAVIELKPVHLNDPLGNKGQTPNERQADYRQIQTARAIIQVMRGELVFEELSFLIDKQQVKMIMAATMVKMGALGVEPPDTMYQFMIAAFVEDLSAGAAALMANTPPPQPPAPQEAAPAEAAA